MTEGKGGWGMVPEGSTQSFQRYNLGDFAKVRQGYTFKPNYQGTTEAKWAYAKVSDMESHGNFKWLKITSNYISDLVLVEMKASPFPKGTIVFPRVGAALRTNKKRMLPQAMLVDDNLMTVIVTDTTKCNSEYLYYWFELTNIEKFANDGALPSINGKNLLSSQILLPPLQEQRKIADILSTWDEAIETLEKLIKAKEKRKRALMQGLLTGKKRFEEFAGLEWQQTRLEEYIFEVTDRNAGGAIEQVLSITNTAGFVLPDEVFSKRVASKNIENYKVVRRGQFAYNPSRINVGSLAYLHAFEVGVISPMYVVFDVKSGLSKDFLFHWFGSDEAVKNIAQSTQGSVRDSVNYSALANFEIKVPKLAEQKAITHVLNLADAEISNLQRGLELYKRQKRGLMQELLTGKTRVRV